jgi:hypothetical protein
MGEAIAAVARNAERIAIADFMIPIGFDAVFRLERDEVLSLSLVQKPSVSKMVAIDDIAGNFTDQWGSFIPGHVATSH